MKYLASIICAIVAVLNIPAMIDGHPTAWLAGLGLTACAIVGYLLEKD